MSESIEELIRKVEVLRAEGKIPPGVTREERISWVYGNCKLSNPLVTREMVEAAVDGVSEKQALYIQPMTARDAVFAEGRKAGLREAAEHLDWTVKALQARRRSADCGPVHRAWATDAAVRDELERHAAELLVMAGEP